LMTDTPLEAAFPRPGHDHHACIALAIERAERAFAAKGLRLTEQRRRVLEEIAASHHAVGAYEILERLAQKGKRLFFACHTKHTAGGDQIVLTCERCGRVAEVPGKPVFDAIAKAARQVSFQPGHTIAEVSGVCAECRAD